MREGLRLFDRRGLMLTAGAAALAGEAAAQSTTTALPFNATVGPGGYPTIGAAIAAAPGDGSPWRIQLAPGRWREKLVITRPNVEIVGADRANCVITYEDAARTTGPDGNPLGTNGSATVQVRAAGFTARNLTIENAFDYDAAARSSGGVDPQTDSRLQAVALMLGDGAQHSFFADCNIVGHQDTLFANVGTSCFRNCRVSGTVDFVFGAGRALFLQCEVVSRTRSDASGRLGWIAAPSTPRSQFYGLNFYRCRLLKEPGVPATSVGLGRFWRPTRDFPDGRYGDPNAAGAGAFMYCWMDDHIIPQGWDPMGYVAQDGRRATLTPEEARPVEYESVGPGASPRLFQLTPSQARYFSTSRILDGWEPA